MYAHCPFVDWFVFAMSILAGAASCLEAEVRVRKSNAAFTAALLHPVMFACAVTLGPFRTLVPGLCAGLCRVVSRPESRVPLKSFIYESLGPAIVACSSSMAFVLCGGDIMWPQNIDSLPAIACAGAVYMLVSATLFWSTQRTDGKEFLNSIARQPVIAGWCGCLLAGYALAVFCASAPSYAVYSVSLGCAITTWALASTERRKSESVARDNTPVLHEPMPPASLFLDEDTGLANRRYLELFLQREVGRSERLGKSLSVAVFNVDNFRQLDENTALQVVSNLGRTISAGIREYDIAARHSDGRLVVVLPETPFETALEVVERLRKSADTGDVAISVGLASYPDHASDAQELINAAHYALNSGRSKGGNTVHFPQDLAKAS